MRLAEVKPGKQFRFSKGGILYMKLVSGYVKQSPYGGFGTKVHEVTPKKLSKTVIL